VFLTLVACVIEDPIYTVLDPSETGPWPVGRITATVDDDRGGRLTVEVWYPATEAPEPAAYSPTIFTGVADYGAPRAEGPFPLVAFSHGNSGIRWQSYFVTEWLAAHGFVVVAPDHPHNTLFDYDPSVLTEVMQRRPGDISRAATWVMEEFGTETTYLVVGHSFGGWTTLAVTGGEFDEDWVANWCDQGGVGELCGLIDPEGEPPEPPDPRAYGGVAMAPCGWYTFGEAGLGGVEGVAVMGGELDTICPMATEIEPTAERVGEPTLLYEVPKGGHFIFSVMCEVGPLQPECADENYAQPEDAWAGIAETTTAWALRQWSGDGAYDAWLP
jgi:predicted dienelactone hydrolase